ncbi:hypothetical protein BgiMline_023827 [Biomphalaria glabrata]|nr:hypothetical protein BgiMline_007063 [Biomphalaria glabrata]
MKKKEERDLEKKREEKEEKERSKERRKWRKREERRKRGDGEGKEQCYAFNSRQQSGLIGSTAQTSS